MPYLQWMDNYISHFPANVVMGRRQQTMVTSSNGNIFRVTRPLCEEFIGPRRIPLTKASDVGFWCFILCAPEQTLIKQPRRRRFEMPSSWLWRHSNAILAFSEGTLNLCIYLQNYPYFMNFQVMLYRKQGIRGLFCWENVITLALILEQGQVITSS